MAQGRHRIENRIEDLKAELPFLVRGMHARAAHPPNVATVGTASPVPVGEVAWLFLDEVRLAVANVGGHLYAFRDSCTHCGHSLAEGELKGPTVICPRDLRAFDVRTGEALGGVPLSPVTTYAVHVDGDEVRVCMHPTRTP